MKRTLAIRILLLFLMVSAAVLSARCGPSVEPADLVIHQGKIVTLDPARPQAEALAVRGDSIVAVGGNDEIGDYIGASTQVIDLAGDLAIPGFIEGHGHFLGIGNARMILNLMPVKNWDEIVSMVGAAARQAEPGGWILGRGWHQEKWDSVPPGGVDGLPHHSSLSAVSPDNPVLLTHASGHASFANARAMELAGVTSRTPDPPGGEIVRDRRGRPIGAFRERAQGLIRRALAEHRAGLSEEQVREQIREQARLAAEECLSKGITSFQDAGSSFSSVDVFRSMAESGELAIRLYVMIREPNERLAELLPRYRMIDAANRMLTVRAIKRTIDGALGSHGAWLLEPYSDMPSSRGLNTASVEDVTETARLASLHGYQLCVHAIGDRANREVLDIFQDVYAGHDNPGSLRWRIEHAQHLHPDDIPRFAELRVIASMQGVHATSDGPWVVERLGEERAREGAYVWQSLMKSGAVVSNGTDAPVEDVSPIASFYASVSRRMNNGEVFFGDERMSREQALRSYTASAAYAAFEEGVKGSLQAGKLADITILDRDIMTVPEEEIPGTRVLYTIVGGKVAYGGN